LAIEIKQAPREHVGLGAGTQLSLSVTAALLAALRLPIPSGSDLARLAGRGIRSAVGTYGFQHGGLLVEAGKHVADTISPLVARVELPERWRFVLFILCEPSGISGDKERAAFGMLPPVPREATERLTREILLELLPAAIADDFHQFSRSLHRFNAAAGLLFAAAQGGPFAAGATSALVDWLRRAGIEGVGQSSWGPTVFALCRDEDEAHECVAQSQRRWPANEIEIVLAPPANRGAQIALG
jgi:beta-ribofuranosylaminobenzene 5'-phosphate synthase